ncbi:MAG TPA: hypothetical protein PKJ97_04085 [Candidatus Bilamarchaeaceae archaeon]|nr:hypothetical protein [Candidatus Bilamarchaeaceae archaeon]
MNRALIALSVAFLLAFSGCVGELMGHEQNCIQNRTATPCTNAALNRAILHDDAAGGVAMCDMIDTSRADVFIGSGRDRCYMEVARVTNNESVCGNIDPLNTFARGLCEDRAAPPKQSTFCLAAAILPLFAPLLFSRRS